MRVSGNIAIGGLALGLVAALTVWTGPEGTASCGSGPDDPRTECRTLSGLDAATPRSTLHGAAGTPGAAIPDLDMAANPYVATHGLERGATAERAGAAMASALARQSGSAIAPTEAEARMTPAERAAFRIAAQGCWTYDPASPVGRSTVTVGFDLDREGRVAGAVELVWHDAPTPDAADEAFEAARRAILGCQTHAVPLPPESHEHSRYAEMTFEAPTRAIR